MRVAITGSYGAGKTTLARALSEVLEQPYQPLPPMTAPLGQAGKPATHCSSAELAELLVRRLMDRAAVELARPQVISDGSLLHDWAFVRTLLMHGPMPGPNLDADADWQIASLEPTRRAIHTRMRGLYDVVVHLPVEFPLTTDDPPVSERFRELSDVYLTRELECGAVTVSTLTGPLDERLDHCLHLVRAAAETGPARDRAVVTSAAVRPRATTNARSTE
jgi:energy-coupling factor transporter ATP-binding protein EcfA2